MKKFLIVLVLVLSMLTVIHDPISIAAPQSGNDPIDVVSSPNDKRAEAICEEIYKSTNVLANFTTTLCAPAKGEKKGSLSLLLFTTDRVTREEATRKLWVFSSVAVVGAVMRKHHNNVIVDKMVLADKELAEQNKGFELPIATAKNLQQKFETKILSLDQFYDAIMASGKYLTVKK